MDDGFTAPLEFGVSIDEFSRGARRLVEHELRARLAPEGVALDVVAGARLLARAVEDADALSGQDVGPGGLANRIMLGDPDGLEAHPALRTALMLLTAAGEDVGLATTLAEADGFDPEVMSALASLTDGLLAAASSWSGTHPGVAFATLVEEMTA